MSRPLNRKRVLAAALLASLFFTSASAFAQAPMMVPVPAGARIDHASPMGNLGKSIRVSGSTLIMGGGAISPSTGAVLVFEESGPDNWVFRQILPGATASEDTGITIAIDGDIIAVGSPAGDGSIEESVAIYEKSGTTWTMTEELSEGNGTAAFGRCIDLQDDTLVIGSPFLGLDGRVLFYRKSGTQWVQDFVASHPLTTGTYMNFGVAVALDGDVAVVGSPNHPTDQLTLYRRIGTQWTADETIGLSDWGTLAADGFVRAGERVALSGSTLLVRVTEWPPVPGYRSGVAVLEDSGNGYVFQQLLEASDAIGGPEAFGYDFSTDGEQIVIGAPLDAPRGSGYLFRREMAGFVEESKFVPTSGESTIMGGNVISPEFGYSVSITPDTLAFGARLDSGFIPRQGAGYVFTNVQSSSTIQGFCFGDGGGTPGCTPCPCANNAVAGTLGGCLNSAGTSAVLAAIGEARLSADNVRLEVNRAQPDSVILLVSSESILPLDLGSGPCPRGSGVRSLAFDGLRCVGSPSRRHGLRMTDSLGSTGVTNEGWGGPFEPSIGLLADGGFSAGQNRFFQAVYRDDGTTSCGRGINTTNAVSVMVIP